MKEQRIYIASRVKHAELWKWYRDKVGIPIISSWIDEAGQGETANFGELWKRIQTEVSTATRLVLFVADNDDFPLKGALIEVGMAIQANVPVHVALGLMVKLEERTFRPLGSWVRHPLVKFPTELHYALAPENP